MGDKESRAKRKKVVITLDDFYSSVLQRYSPSAVIMMYQEIAQACGNSQIDWKKLARRTSTGITNAREYQMLWRHLAYGHPLVDKIEQGAELLDDESDVEIDLEAVPHGSAEDIADAHASVKVLLASGPFSDLRMINNSAPDASSAPNEKQNVSASENAHVAGNSGLHASSQKPLSQAYKPSDGLDGNASNLPRKKRNKWTEEEDKELIAAVNKCGESSWANILKGDFNLDRTPSQLSQRWSILKKQNNNIGFGGSCINGRQLSQAHLATRNALSVALNMPVTLTTSAAMSTSAVSNSTSAVNPSEALPATHSIPQVPEGQPQTSTLLGTSAASLKNRLDAKKSPVPVKPSISSTAMLQAAAVAAGARIATPEDAESLLKAAQAKNAVYIMNGGATVLKSGTVGPLPSTHLGAPHFAGVGMPGTSLSNSSVTMPNVPKVGLTKHSNAAPRMTSEKHSLVSKAEVSAISKQAKATDLGIHPSLGKELSKLVNESDGVERPHECQQPSTPAEEGPRPTPIYSEVAASPASEGKKPATDEKSSSISTENGGSAGKLLSNSDVAASEL